LFLRTGKFFNGRNEALKINQPDATTSAATFQTVRFDLAGFAEQINLRARQAGEWAKCAGLRKPHEAWLQLRYARRCLVLFGAIATVSHARVGKRRDAQKIFPFTIHATETLCEAETVRACHAHGISKAADTLPKRKVSFQSVQSHPRSGQIGSHLIRSGLAFARLQPTGFGRGTRYPS